MSRLPLSAETRAVRAGVAGVARSVDPALGVANRQRPRRLTVIGEARALRFSGGACTDCADA